MARNTARAAIKHDLLDQLERNGTVGKHYIDLVDDYMALWDTKNALIADINTRGVLICHVSNTGQENLKRNDSVGDLVKVNDRMMRLLSSLGIEPVQADGGMDDEM